MRNKPKSRKMPAPVLRAALLSMAWLIPMMAVAQVTPTLPADPPLQSLHGLAGKSDSTTHRIRSLGDSLLLLQAPARPRQTLLTIEQRTDSLHQALQTRLDSLLQLPAPDSLITGPLQRLAAQTDSLRNRIASLKNKIQTPEELKKMEAAIQHSSTKINEQLTSLQNKGVPMGSLEKLKIPSMPGTNFPDLKIPEFASIMPAAPSMTLPAGKLPAINTSLPNTAVQLPQAGTALPNPLTDVTGNISNIKVPDAGAVNATPEEIEKQVMETGGLSDLNRVIDPAERAKRYYDPDVAKEEALNKAKEAAVNHFAGHEKELEAAIQKLSELKARFPDAEQALDLFARRQKQLAGTRWVDRLVPGLTLQGYSQRSFGLDLNPQLAFRISYRWAAGAGWVERVAYNFDLHTWDHENRMYGARAFVHFKLRENFYLKGDVELVSSALNGPAKNNETRRVAVWNYLGGIKRDFQLSEKMKGNIQVLYTIYRSSRQSSAYVNAFHLRLGIDIPLKKN